MAVADAVAGGRTQLLRIGTLNDDGSVDCRPWAPRDCIFVPDSRARIFVGYDGSSPALEKMSHLEKSQRLGFGPAPEMNGEGGLTWSVLDLGKLLSAKRRLGLAVFPLRYPRGAEIRLFILPARLITPTDVQAMLADVGQFLGTTLTESYEAQPSGGPQIWRGTAWFTSSVSARAPMVSEGLVERELPAALALRRAPYALASLTPHGLTPYDPAPQPEDRVVSHWARRRLTQMRQVCESLQAQLAELARRCEEPKTQDRDKELRAQHDHVQDRLQHATRLSGRVAALLRRQDTTRMLHLTPGMQRDWRLRRLLGAFARPLQRSPRTDIATGVSDPLAPLNDLFELWGAIWIVRQFTSLGFVAQSHRPWRGSLITGCAWRLTREGTEVFVDYEPDPILLHPQEVRRRSERRAPWREVAAGQATVQPDRPYLSCNNAASPDYGIRILTAGRTRLLVGDACLCEPVRSVGGSERVNTDKSKKVARYVTSLACKTGDGEVVQADPMGGFVIHLHPQTRWDPLDGHEAAPDVMVVAADPCKTEDTDATEDPGAQRFRLFLQEFIDEQPAVLTPPSAG